MGAKWQEALTQWDEWLASIKTTRAKLETQYADLNSLVAESRLKWHKKEQVSTSFEIELNTGASILWRLHGELHEIASKFVSQEIGLPPQSIQHHLFVRHWVKSVLPAAMRQPQFETPEASPVWFDSRVAKRGKEHEIVDTVSWYRSEVDPRTVAKMIWQGRLLANNGWLLKKAKGGRPSMSRELTIYPEAITCAILKDKQSLTYKEIAKQFSWKTQEDDHGNLICNTATNRVRLGREILRRHKDSLGQY